MPNDTPDAKERIDAIPRTARVLGIDDHGRTHLYDLRHPLEIWVVDTEAERCVHYREIGESSLVDWALFVADDYGWDTRHHIEKQAFEGLLDPEPTPPTREEVLP